MTDKVVSDDFLNRILKIREELKERFAKLISQLTSFEESLLQEMDTLESDYMRETITKRENLENLLIVKNNMQGTGTSREETDLIDKQIQMCRESINSKCIGLEWSPDLQHVLLSPFCKINVTETLTPSVQDSKSDLGLSGYVLNIHSHHLPSPPISHKIQMSRRSSTPSPESICHSTSLPSEPMYSAYAARDYAHAEHSPSNEQFNEFDASFNSMQIGNGYMDLIDRYVSITTPLHSACPHGVGKGNLRNPRAVAIDRRKNRIYIADKTNDRVQVFSDTGLFVFTFTHHEMTGPKGICVEEQLGLVFVTLCEQNAVHSYRMDGQFVQKIGSFGISNAQFNQPCGIDTDCVCKVYVCDFGNDRVQVFSHNFRYLTVLTNKVTKPTDIKVIGNSVYVLDHHKYCISLFNRGGAFIRELIVCGPETNQVKHPYFFDVDLMGNILISDLWNNCIKVFSASGKFMCSIGSGGEAPGQFLRPTGIALVEECIVTVCDRGQNQLQIFQL